MEKMKEEWGRKRRERERERYNVHDWPQPPRKPIIAVDSTNPIVRNDANTSADDEEALKFLVSSLSTTVGNRKNDLYRDQIAQVGNN